MRRTPTGVVVALAIASLLAGASMLNESVGASRGDLLGEPVPGGGRSHPAAGGGGTAAHDDPGGSQPVRGRGTAAGLPPVFARHEGVTLRLPMVAPLGVRFTQGRRVGAVPLEPLGTLTVNANPQGFDASRVVETANGPEFAVAAPAGRGRPPTSAAVISMPGAAWVRAPLTGTVLDVQRPEPDGEAGWRMVLHPEIRPEVRVTITGLHQPRADPGDTVTAGETLGLPRLVRDGVAEVAIEMRPASAPIRIEGDADS